MNTLVNDDENLRFSSTSIGPNLAALSFYGKIKKVCSYD
jgi:hypothetical protein